MIAYLIKSTVCMLLLLGVYYAFLEREKMHRFNRYFLIFSLIFSLTIPLLTINIGAPARLSDQIDEINSRLAAEPPATTEYVPVPNTEGQPSQTVSGSNINFISLLIGLYGIIASILLVRLLRNLYLLVRKTRMNPTVSLDKCTLVLVDDCPIPHSFFSYIFVDKQLYETGQIREEILNHELTHVRQKHSLDILFIELLKVIFWFNPVLWSYKKAIQTNHEFLADQSVVANSDDIHHYQKLLLKMQSGENDLHLASSIQFSITKKRFMMMTKKSTRLHTTCKQLSLIPVLAGLVFAFSTRTADAQNVEQMSLTELMQAASERMDTVDSLTDEEKEKLQNLVSKIQTKLQPKAPPPPPPPTPANDPGKALQAMEQAYKEHVAYYNGIEPVETNIQELEKIYKRAMRFYHEIDELQPKVYDNPPPLPPKPAEPDTRIKLKEEKIPPAEISERSFLTILVNEEGLILMDEEPVPVEKVKEYVKKFITNNGADPELSESPQKAAVLLKTAKRTPYNIYTQMIDSLQQAYREVLNEAAQAEYGIKYETLVENSPAQTKIRKMYPVRISIADPEQKETDSKKSPPPPKPPAKADTTNLNKVKQVRTPNHSNTKNSTERIEEYSKNPSPPNPLEEVNEKNLLKILVNWERLILIDEEPTPIEKVKATVKAFITNNGAESDLSESPQKAVVSIKTAEETPYGIFNDILHGVQNAYSEVRNAAAQAEFGFNYNELPENSPSKTKIQEMYPMQISVASRPAPPPPKPQDSKIRIENKSS